MRELTTDTSSYVWPSVSADGHNLVATQRQFKFAISVASTQSPDNSRPLSLASDLPVSRWSWMPDGRLVVSQVGEIRTVSPHGQESIILSDKKDPPDQVAVCAGGRNMLPKRVPIIGGTPETVYDSALAGAALSPDGKTLVNSRGSRVRSQDDA